MIYSDLSVWWFINTEESSFKSSVQQIQWNRVMVLVLGLSDFHDGLKGEFYWTLFLLSVFSVLVDSLEYKNWEEFCILVQQ